MLVRTLLYTSKPVTADLSQYCISYRRQLKC